MIVSMETDRGRDLGSEEVLRVGNRHPLCSELMRVRTPIWYALLKRLFDILGSIFLLVLLSPLLLCAALAVKATSRGPILYRSMRVGYAGILFTFYKFRSMRVGADKMLVDLKERNEKDGPIFKMKDDPRLTPFGRWMRRFSIDELPQLLNVLKGDMSLVGPRPMLPHEVMDYKSDDFERLKVQPGITCYWQVMGRSRLSFDEWMELDRKYVRDRSFATDLRILIVTPIAVIRGDGAY